MRVLSASRVRGSTAHFPYTRRLGGFLREKRTTRAGVGGPAGSRSSLPLRRRAEARLGGGLASPFPEEDEGSGGGREDPARHRDEIAEDRAAGAVESRLRIDRRGDRRLHVQLAGQIEDVEVAVGRGGESPAGERGLPRAIGSL